MLLLRLYPTTGKPCIANVALPYLRAQPSSSTALVLQKLYGFFLNSGLNSLSWLHFHSFHFDVLLVRNLNLGSAVHFILCSERVCNLLAIPSIDGHT